MKLTGVEIKDYKSIRHSTSFEVGQITCLVGKNESGKTAILQALYKLNPVVPEHSKFDVTDEYPRAEVEEYRQQVENEEIKPAIVVQAEYTLDSDEIKAVEAAYGKGVLPKRDDPGVEGIRRRATGRDRGGRSRRREGTGPGPQTLR